VPAKNSPLLEKLPDQALIRSRLAELATEANFLRALLRLLRKSSPDQRAARKVERQEAASA
jgi:hypothetical protein